jgi:hypothetical protein
MCAKTRFFVVFLYPRLCFYLAILKVVEARSVLASLVFLTFIARAVAVGEARKFVGCAITRESGNPKTKSRTLVLHSTSVTLRVVVE